MTLMQAFPARTRGVPLPGNRPVYRPLREPLGARGGTAPRRRPGPCRPGGAALRYPRTGVAISTAPHRRRPASVATTVGLAVLAGMITLWLGLMAHFGELVNGNSADSSGMPDRLAVVRVAAGESLQDVAARVAPDTPVRQVVERIRELNDLDSSMPVAGQTLIAPVG
ncbi:LysM peptidoglycan-binding domain-containing protein [Mycobacterium persicum]|uniref:Membrane protein n=4 Tax=Mycobacterium TaxID=1763 RepID=A0A7G1IF71_MYCKA|nr:hypothetical protein A4G31_23535 [Mycobacterium persicum]BCI89470.1 membrane protein [Mycobacterium kansasii]ORB58323.1 hypothetical protein BST40_02890 [Mycobacterium persicum]ORB98528.1 hypothetical protein B1T44_25180 [Mycobacterium persicum]VAZ74285.1 hypothetical protein LAUMK15_02196 [Mycobacterium persicum]